ncbi:MAG: heme-binding domain-containing protein [Saprospiraceae bacterium]
MLKKIAWSALVLLLLIQFIRPNQTNPLVNASLDFQTVANPPAEVLTSLKNACYNCHSFETKYPWYTQVAPVSWWLANHIEEGRAHLNFSEFDKLSPEDRTEALGECTEVLQEGEMPLPSYTWLGLHPEANLSESQRNYLVQWFNANGGEASNSEEHEKNDNN